MPMSHEPALLPQGGRGWAADQGKKTEEKREKTKTKREEGKRQKAKTEIFKKSKVALRCHPIFSNDSLEGREAKRGTEGKIPEVS